MLIAIVFASVGNDLNQFINHSLNQYAWLMLLSVICDFDLNQFLNDFVFSLTSKVKTFATHFRCYLNLLVCVTYDMIISF